MNYFKHVKRRGRCCSQHLSLRFRKHAALYFWLRSLLFNAAIDLSKTKDVSIKAAVICISSCQHCYYILCIHAAALLRDKIDKIDKRSYTANIVTSSDPCTDRIFTRPRLRLFFRLTDRLLVSLPSLPSLSYLLGSYRCGKPLLTRRIRSLNTTIHHLQREWLRSSRQVFRSERTFLSTTRPALTTGLSLGCARHFLTFSAARTGTPLSLRRRQSRMKTRRSFLPILG